jgi:hypothetical protein
MRRVSVATRNELVDAVRERYVRGGRAVPVSNAPRCLPLR